MKHIENINEWFGNKKQEGDDFAEKLVDIVEKENIEIENHYAPYGYWYYLVNVDGVEYRFCTEESEKMFSLLWINTIKIWKNGVLDNEIKISSKYYDRIEKMYKQKQKQKEEKEKKMNNLPDISNVGRAAAKYNI
jgi:hypothetical protein